MTIPEQKIYPRTGDRQTVYLKAVITDPNISVGDYTMYNDFVKDPVLFDEIPFHVSVPAFFRRMGT